MDKIWPNSNSCMCLTVDAWWQHLTTQHFWHLLACALNKTNPTKAPQSSHQQGSCASELPLLLCIQRNKQLCIKVWNLVTAFQSPAPKMFHWAENTLKSAA